MNRVLSGRADRVIYNPKTGVVLVQDFKTGWSEPDSAEQNAQLKVLAVLAALNIKYTGKMVSEVIVQIISGPYGITEARYDYPTLAKAYDEILSTLKAIADPHAPLNPGVEQCRYCAASLICQPCRKLLSPPTKLQVAHLPTDPHKAAKILDEIAILEGVFEEVKKFYFNYLSKGMGEITGYGLQPGVVRREVVDWLAARQRLAEWLDLEEINGAANYRLGDLEKALGRKLKIKGKELKERMGQILNGLIEEKQNSASLKRTSAKGRALVELP